ncbi:MAG: hypothetical protein KF691_08375 [Phycisphaeraceae bacterium]|nr:hypothetical protein [Phycisphaeraceae bacterium]
MMAESNSRATSSPPDLGRKRGLLSSKSLWLAILITLAGAAWWAYSATGATRTPAAPVPVSGFAASPTNAPPEPRVQAPAAFRYGASFVGAFLIAFVLKKIIRSVLLIAAILVGAVLALKYFGLMDFDWSNAQRHVEDGAALAREESEKYRTLLLSYLPSGLASGAGALFGAKRG